MEDTEPANKKNDEKCHQPIDVCVYIFCENLKVQVRKLSIHDGEHATMKNSSDVFGEQMSQKVNKELFTIPAS